jgi:hypothetical protein
MRRMSYKSRLIGLAGAVLLVVSTPGAASAADDGVATTRVKSAKLIGLSATYVDGFTHKTTVMRVVANFTSHTTSSVKLKSYKLCFSQTSRLNENLKTWVKVKGSVSYTGPLKWDVQSGSCTSNFSVNKTYKASPGKELFVIQTNTGYGKLTFLHGFYR